MDSNPPQPPPLFYTSHQNRLGGAGLAERRVWHSARIGEGLQTGTQGGMHHRLADGGMGGTVMK